MYVKCAACVEARVSQQLALTLLPHLTSLREGPDTERDTGSRGSTPRPLHRPRCAYSSRSIGRLLFPSEWYPFHKGSLTQNRRDTGEGVAL
jgi:hypothetical protein